MSLLRIVCCRLVAAGHSSSSLIDFKLTLQAEASKTEFMMELLPTFSNHPHEAYLSVSVRLSHVTASALSLLSVFPILGTR
jgi:hypothetical protein